MSLKELSLEDMEKIHDNISNEIDEISEHITSCSNNSDTSSCGSLLKKRNELVSLKQKLKKEMVEKKKKRDNVI